MLDIRPEDEPPGIRVSGESIFRSDKGIARGTSSPQVGHFFETRRKRERSLSGTRLDYDLENSSDSLLLWIQVVK